MNTSFDNPNIVVDNCTFASNYATTRQGNFIYGLPDQVFQSGVYRGRAGAIGIFVRESYFNITATISNCHMFNNSAQFYGGSTYILLNGDGGHVANVVDNVFESNLQKMGEEVW